MRYLGASQRNGNPSLEIFPRDLALIPEVWSIIPQK